MWPWHGTVVYAPGSTPLPGAAGRQLGPAARPLHPEATARCPPGDKPLKNRRGERSDSQPAAFLTLSQGPSYQSEAPHRLGRAYPAGATVRPALGGGYGRNRQVEQELEGIPIEEMRTVTLTGRDSPETGGGCWCINQKGLPALLHLTSV